MHTIFAFKKSKDFFYFTEKCKFLNWTFLFMNILEELKKLREEYLSADEETKRFLEKRYGKRAINQALEETFSAEWLEKNAKMCPYCGTQIQASFWVNVNKWFFFCHLHFMLCSQKQTWESLKVVIMMMLISITPVHNIKASSKYLTKTTLMHKNMYIHIMIAIMCQGNIVVNSRTEEVRLITKQNILEYMSYRQQQKIVITEHNCPLWKHHDITSTQLIWKKMEGAKGKIVDKLNK